MLKLYYIPSEFKLAVPDTYFEIPVERRSKVDVLCIVFVPEQSFCCFIKAFCYMFERIRGTIFRVSQFPYEDKIISDNLFHGVISNKVTFQEDPATSANEDGTSKDTCYCSISPRAGCIGGHTHSQEVQLPPGLGGAFRVEYNCLCPAYHLQHRQR